MAHLDKISLLHDELLLRILSLLPAKQVVATLVLSKRWQFLWASVPTLLYDDSYEKIEYETFSRFVYKSLILHGDAIIENLEFKLRQKSAALDIGVWSRIAVKLCVRKLLIDINCSSSRTRVIIPRSLYLGSTILVHLRLKSVVLLDFTSVVSFPSLKYLSLKSVKYPNNEYMETFLSNCPVLEKMIMERHSDDIGTLYITVPSLLVLVLDESPEDDKNDARGFVINAPSLQEFDIVNHMSGFCVLESNIPDIIHAYVEVSHSHPWKILSSIASAKRLVLCLGPSMEVYPLDTVFHRLVHLRICTCETEWMNILMHMLKASPNLKSLEFELFHDCQDGVPRPCWSEPNPVPECVVSSLETLVWVTYEGTEEEKELVAFMLRNAKRLKEVTIYSEPNDLCKKFEMVKELALSPRLSSTCQLIFS